MGDRVSRQFFFFNDTATTEISPLPLHDALPISRTSRPGSPLRLGGFAGTTAGPPASRRHSRDRKSTRLNSSHANISYAVFCLKKKTKPDPPTLLSTTTAP